MYLFAIIVIVLFALFGIIFGAQNTVTVSLKLFAKSFDVPLISVMIVSFGSGVVLAFVLAIVDEIRLRRKIQKQQKEIETLKRELGTLKTMPIEEERA